MEEMENNQSEETTGSERAAEWGKMKTKRARLSGLWSSQRVVAAVREWGFGLGGASVTDAPAEETW